LNDVNQQEDDRNNQKDVQRTTQCGGGYHSQQPKYDAKDYKKQHFSLPRHAYA
jgi:hypothetical protein